LREGKRREDKKAKSQMREVPKVYTESSGRIACAKTFLIGEFYRGRIVAKNNLTFYGQIGLGESSRKMNAAEYR